MRVPTPDPGYWPNKVVGMSGKNKHLYSHFIVKSDKMEAWEADFHYKTAARRPGQNTHTPFLCCFIVFGRGPPVPEGPKCEKGGLRKPRGRPKKGLLLENGCIVALLFIRVF